MSKRRASGSGALLKWRKDGQVVGWIGVADLGVVDGKRRRQKVYGRSQGEVQKRLAELLHKKEHGTLAKPGRATVAEWLTEWLRIQERSPKQLKPRTLEFYELVVRKHLIPALGTKQLTKLTRADVEGMLGSMLRAGLSPQSVRHVKVVLNSALNRAEQEGKIDRNVARRADAPTVPDPDRSAVEKFSHQIPTFLKAVEGEPLRAMYVLTLTLGLRFGEVAGLRWSDIDMDAGALTVRKALQWIRPAGGGSAVAQLLTPKSEKSRRSIELSTPVLEVIRKHRTLWLERKIALGDRWLNSWDLVFVGASGESLHPRAICDEFDAILRRAGLPDIRFHDLRHANASLMLDHIPMEMLSRLLGHSKVSTTQDIYAHVLQPLRDQAKRAQAAILGG